MQLSVCVWYSHTHGFPGHGQLVDTCTRLAFPLFHSPFLSRRVDAYIFIYPLIHALPYLFFTFANSTRLAGPCTRMRIYFNLFFIYFDFLSICPTMDSIYSLGAVRHPSSIPLRVWLDATGLNLTLHDPGGHFVLLHLHVSAHTLTTLPLLNKLLYNISNTPPTRTLLNISLSKRNVCALLMAHHSAT